MRLMQTRDKKLVFGVLLSALAMGVMLAAGFPSLASCWRGNPTTVCIATSRT
jgi:hypothetical protein